MRGWGRDCFPLSDRHISLHSECLAQATSQEAPRNFVPPFRQPPSSPPHPEQQQKKLKVKKLLFKRNSFAAKFRFLYQDGFFVKIWE